MALVVLACNSGERERERERNRSDREIEELLLNHQCTLPPLDAAAIECLECGLLT